MMKLPSFAVECEVIATVVRWLIVPAADLVITNFAQKQCSDSAVGDDSDVAAAINRGSERMIDSYHDAAPGVDGTLPSTYALRGIGKELVRQGFEFQAGQISRRRAVILAQLGDG